MSHYTTNSLEPKDGWTQNQDNKAEGTMETEDGGTQNQILQELKSYKVPGNIHTAAEVLINYYFTSKENPETQRFFTDLSKLIRKADEEQVSSSQQQTNKTSLFAVGEKWTVKVDMVTTGQTFGADRAMMKQVKCSTLQVKPSDRKGCDVVVLFCPVTSRVVPDVERAMKKVSDTQQVILVIMHHTRDVDYSTAGRNWPDVYPNVALDVHVLFHETMQGLLTCPKNDQAVRDIQNKLQEYGSSSSSCCVC